ncbi:hypothetical protein LGM43_13650 [Burkholderia seminalis]|uniref:hypothetical protein n=1 Tax=Burkholderia seminalis TaxID=488731 RepID=UPI00158E565E|nr:hypothetical protein [Burkholderia seminalis]MCA7951314.1 hypothetical protein [Burkholderia seminalis]
MGSNPASRATLKGLSFGKALFLFRLPSPLLARALPQVHTAAGMKTAAIGRRPSLDLARARARQ